jgi:hypothetical protein
MRGEEKPWVKRRKKKTMRERNDKLWDWIAE